MFCFKKGGYFKDRNPDALIINFFIYFRHPGTFSVSYLILHLNIPTFMLSNTVNKQKMENKIKRKRDRK